uniref:Tubulin delta chain n=1 Tax=Naja naja TaxID=35670 RepID=A0A8C6X7N7_NAJNA
MSILAIQLGQCGNQIGREVFDTICTDLHSSQGFCSRKENDAYQALFCKKEVGFFPPFSFSCLGMVARAVLVDMEPKVINQTLSFASRTGNWRYGPQSAFCQKQGSGNNWAHGYCVHGSKHEDVIMNLIRKEAEKCDRLGGFLMIMSMAGGTGSGLGAFVTAALREAYPNSFLLNHVIWPYGTGEVIVQNYNSVLTLSHLYQSSDALLVHENDAVHKICLQLMKIKQVSFQDVNRAIAHQLGSVFQPAYSSEGAAHYSRSPLGIDWQVRPPTSRAPAAEKPSSNRAVNFNTSIANLVTLRGKEVQCADLSKFVACRLPPLQQPNRRRRRRHESQGQHQGNLGSDGEEGIELAEREGGREGGREEGGREAEPGPSIILQMASTAPRSGGG